MNNLLRNTLITLAVLGIFASGMMFANLNGFGLGSMMNNFGNNGYALGMMGGSNNNGYDSGMMGGNDKNNYGPGMMGNQSNNTNAAPLSVDQAKIAAESYIKTLGVDGLQVSEVMVFDNNAYVVVKETDSGLGAFELLVDPASKIAYPEFGPNMMWNLKYGGLNHSQMMGGRNGMTLAPGASAGVGGYGWDKTIPTDVSAEMSVTPQKAIEYAQKFLDTKIKGATAATDPVKFYGYYTLDFEKNGKVAGMLSVNGYSGQVFLHTWHGTFIEETSMQ